MFEVEENDQIPEFEKHNYDSALMDIDINEEQILKIINALQPKSKGPDRIHPRILKEINQCIRSPLEKNIQEIIRRRHPVERLENCKCNSHT